MLTHNAHEIAVQLQAHGVAMERALLDEMAAQAQRATRKMRELAPKWRSALTNSIKSTQTGPYTWEIRPGVDYGLYREKGRRPGKGLPKFGTPGAQDLTDWLREKAFAGQRKPRKNSLRFSARELELRDRYMGLSWHVKRKGLKAQPFVAPVAQEFERTLPTSLAAVVQRLVAQASTGGAA